MPGQHQVGRCRADAGIEVLDVVGAGFREGDAVHRKAGAGERAFDQRQRPALGGRHRRAAQEFLGEAIGSDMWEGFRMPALVGRK